MCSRLRIGHDSEKSALIHIGIRQTEFFLSFIHHDKSFGYINLSIITANIQESHELNSFLSFFELYVNVMSRILFIHCDKFVIPFLVSNLKRCMCSEICECHEYKQDKIRLSVSWRKLVRRLAIQACQGIDPDFIKFVFYNYKHRQD